MNETPWRHLTVSVTGPGINKKLSVVESDPEFPSAFIIAVNQQNKPTLDIHSSLIATFTARLEQMRNCVEQNPGVQGALAQIDFDDQKYVAS